MASKTNFSKILRKLREERKISQKTVAQELGISQALLSHYEKGVRECGLGFLIKAAKYYEVSSDYLLGLTLESEEDNTASYKKIGNEDENKIDNKKQLKTTSENNYAVLYKNLIKNVSEYIFDNMKGIEYKRTAQISGEYIILSIYSLYKYLVDTKNLNSYEEVEAAKSKLIVELKKGKKHFKHSSNEHINFMLKNGDGIISKINTK